MKKNQNRRVSPFLICCLILFSSGILAQTENQTQTIRGKIVDADTNRPLIGANIILNPSAIGTATDTLGLFRMPDIPVGRYQALVSYIGYDSLLLPEVLVESGKEVVLSLKLSESLTQLSEVLVRANRSDLQAYSPTVQTITVEETLRFPGTFFDPARLVMASAGVVQENDQANGISVRGNSPNGISWRLEGVDIVNPNHTPNAGTSSDRVTQNGGGVIILSSQLLDNSYFFTGAFPVDYGNALSGVMDMHIRKGNNEKNEFVAQVGLIGLEIASEGPLLKKTGSSYLVNYRYSTVGLLSAFGLDLGDEAINYQDLSFNLSFPGKNGSQFTIFGMGGMSENVFEAKRDTSLWEFQKDRFDISFDSRMGAIGTTYSRPIGEKGLWRTTLAASAQENTRTGDRLDDEFKTTREEFDIYNQSKLSLNTLYSYKVDSRSRFRIGAQATQQNYTIESLKNATDTVANGKGSGLLLQPYLGWQSRLAGNININAGMHFIYYAFNETSSMEPRFSVEWSPRNHHISFSYGLHGQLQLPQVYFTSLDGVDNQNLQLTRAHHLVLAYHYDLNNYTQLRTELFYQSLFDVPVSRNFSNSFSALNLVEGFVSEELINEGTGTNYGLGVSLQRYIYKNIYYLLNATWYESKYKGSDGIERNTRFNGNYIFNLTGGKEWGWKKEKSKVLGLNIRVAYIGGFRDTPIDTEASAIAGETIYQSEEAFTIKQQDYFRTDLRFYYKRNKLTFNSMLSLDIQNVTNAENIAFSYYDTQQQAIVQKTQLGIIPILSYRIEF